MKDREGNLLIRTVSDSQRGAVVNWLYTYGRIVMLDSHSDEFIQRAWQLVGMKEHGARAVEVNIEEILP